MKRLDILVGVSGSGKSTYAEKIKKENDKVSIFSTDELRMELYGNLDCFNDDVNIVAENTKNMLKHIKKGMTKHNKHHVKKLTDDVTEIVILDGTNLNRKRRMAIYNELERYEIQINTVVIFSDLGTIRERQNAREEYKKVSMNQVYSQWKACKPFKLGVDTNTFEFVGTAWFNEIEDVFTINTVKDISEYAKVDGIKKEILNNYIDHHCRPYHNETVDEHIALTIENAKNTGNDSLVEIAIFHDLGKAVTKRFNDDDYQKYLEYKDGKELDEDYYNLKSSYKNHQNVGAMFYLNYMYSTNQFEKRNFDILEAIYLHMVAHQGISQKTINKYKLDEEVLYLIEEFRKIDTMSKKVD